MQESCISSTFPVSTGLDEDLQHEFKAAQRCPKPVRAVVDYCVKYINAFLNTAGGTLYCGINDDGTIKGVSSMMYYFCGLMMEQSKA